MSFRRLSALLGLVLLAALPVVAQEQSGAIEGTIRDSAGAAVPGASVQARSSTGASVSTVTNSAGDFRFPALAPGKYEITANLTGFAPGKVSDINLSLGQVMSVNLTLSVGAVAETIQVTAEAPLIDVKQSARFANIRDELIDKMPKGRNFTTLVTQAPGANDEGKLGGLSIDGASAGENRFIIDGAETTNLRNGTSGKALITDFIEEVQVKSSGYTAEYGGSTGGVINVLTKSGTNAWHGEVLSYLASDSLDANRRPTLRVNPLDSTKAEYITYPKDTYTRLDPGFNLSGPLARNKAWLFLGYQPGLQKTDRTVVFRSDRVERTRREDYKIHYFTGNLTTQLGTDTRARLAANFSPSKTAGLLPALDGTSNPLANFDVTTNRSNTTVSLNLDHNVASNFFLSARGGLFRSDINDEGIHEGPRFLFQRSNVGLAGVPANLQQARGYANVLTNNKSEKDVQSRLSAQMDASYFTSFGGQHAFKAGIQLDRIGNDVSVGETGNFVQIYWNEALNTSAGAQRGQFGYYRVRSNGVEPKRGFVTLGNVHSNNIGLFIQDAWSLNDRLTLNLGLRTENERIPSMSSDPSIPDAAIKYGFADKLAPRVGFAWDVKGDARWKVYGSWGLFYDITKLELTRGSFGGDKWLEYWYTLDTADWPNLVAGAGCPPACPGRLIQGPTDFRHPSNDPSENAIDPDIQPFRLQEAVFGIEHELTKVLSVSARYVHKQIDVAVEDIGSLDAAGNEIYTIGNPGVGLAAETGFGPAFPKAKRDYDAVELAFNKRMANNWSARVSYLWSRLFGNYAGLSQSDENGRTSPNVGRSFDYPIMVFNESAQPVEGPLATDRPHQFKAQLIYSFKFGTSVGLGAYVASGIPMTREAAFVSGSAFPVQYLGRGSDGRTPTYSQVDLNVRHEFRLGGSKMLAVEANIDNVFDQDAVTNRFVTQLASGQAINLSPEAFFLGFNTAQLIAAQKIPLDPRFLMDSGFQGGRSIRFGARFRF
jgi:hypothetical protein